MPDDSKIWQAHIKLIDYAVDAGENIIEIEGFTKKVSLDDYLDELYVERSKDKFEQNIEIEAPTFPRILCVSGERGSGKTSALLFVRRRLAQNKPSLKFVRIDLKKSYDLFFLNFLAKAKSLYGNTKEAYQHAFNKLIIHVLKEDFFPHPSDFRKLVTWCLAGEPDDTENFKRDIIADFSLLHREISLLAECEEYDRSARINQILKYFQTDKARYLEMMKEVEERLRVTHLVHGYLCLQTTFKNIILVLDNVDRIPDQYLTDFLIACRDIRMSVENECAITVAIRTENIRERSPIPGDDHFFDIIRPDGEKYKSLLLPKINDEHMKAVFDKRTTFAQKILLEYDKKYHANLSTRWDKIKEYHKKVIGDFVGNRVHALANDSYLTVIKVYIEFMRYIWTLEGRNLITLAALEDEYHLQTLFYVWLQEFGEVVGIPLQNILPYRYKEDAIDASEVGSVNYLLLVCIHNMTLKYHDMHLMGTYPEWAEVVSRMEELCFTYKQIHSALANFITPLGLPPGAIRFRRKEVCADEVDRDSKDMVYLSSLGKELAKWVITKVGYVWGVAIRSNMPGILKKNYHDYSRRERARHVHEFLKILARKHLLFLSLGSTKLKEAQGDDWLDYYKRWFCIDKKLQLERMSSSASSFFKGEFSPIKERELIDPFSAFNSKYSLLVEEIVNGKTYAKLDFASLNAGDEFFKDSAVLKKISS